MKNLSKNNASPLPLLRRPAPAPYFHFLFKIFQIPLPPGEVVKIYFPLPPPPLFKKGRSELCRWTLGSDDLRVFQCFRAISFFKKETAQFSFLFNNFPTKKSPKVVNLLLTDETLCLSFRCHKQANWLL